MATRMTGKLADPEFRRARARKAAAARNSVENHARHVDAAVAAGRVDVLDLMPAVRRVIEARFAADLARRHRGAQWFATGPGDHPAA